ncbi:MAG: hypothetical protein AAF311_16920 [Pseudomonadota bacterium]
MFVLLGNEDRSRPAITTIDQYDRHASLLHVAWWDGLYELFRRGRAVAFRPRETVFDLVRPEAWPECRPIGDDGDGWLFLFARDLPAAMANRDNGGYRSSDLIATENETEDLIRHIAAQALAVPAKGALFSVLSNRATRQNQSLSRKAFDRAWFTAAPDTWKQRGAKNTAIKACLPQDPHDDVPDSLLE